MRYYVDNFRGFQNQIIDLKKVNFLVGDNSSGKTSLIKALDLLFDYSFWINGDFLTDDFDVGYFLDNLSVNNTRKAFTLGMLDDSKKMSILLSFMNSEGLSKLFRITLYINNNLLVLYKKRKNIYYKLIKNNELNYSNNEDILNYVESRNYSEIEEIKVKGWIKSMPLLNCLQFIIRQDSKLKDSLGLINGIIPFNISKTFIAPIRAKPQSIYTGNKTAFTAEGSHTPYLLKKVISKKDKGIEALRDFGKASGLFDDVGTTEYGKSTISPFELVIFKGGDKYPIGNVGYGVSQILPIIVDIVFNNSNVFLIQQPEVHLHPKAQAAFGDFLFTMSLSRPTVSFIIETHSDYIIDRFRYCKNKEEKNRKDNAQILFFQNDTKHNHIQQIVIKEDGKLDEKSILNYRAFFIDESFKVMGI